ncbi:non-specific lipid transfer protein GPI-anchored 1 [Prosopis cineraria]|uniref:non-specific lipid transfer protein GPI-anchored 1 n=1 Tax=Prosopis cineraria TaxID=364024 RepID=UPI00240F6BAB|nr:non-specific lipid transfer protein GPI-anchored 1 [Prosopis cineraria]
MEHQSLCLCLILSLSLVLLGGRSVAGANDLTTKCSQNIQKVMPCLSYATGKEAEPTKQCCEATSSIKESSPECLCFVIQQTHNGNSQSKSLGISEAKLLQLPSACKLAVNMSNCPNLLGLPANSPDAAIFKTANSSSAATPATTNAVTARSNSSADSGSIGSTLRPPLFADILAVALAVLIVAFPTSGFLSVFT